MAAQPPKPPEESMGARLKRLRKDAHLSQEQLADATGLPVGSIRNYEQGRRVPRLDAAARLAKALSVSLDTLAGSVGLLGSATDDSEEDS